MKYKQGDLIQGYKDCEVDCIMHQIHCQGGGYGGFAGKLQREFPKSLPLHKSYQGQFYVYQDFIFSISGQKYPGNCTVEDPYDARLHYLITGIQNIIYLYPEVKIFRVGIPLIGSGLGADLDMKGSMTDLEYFDKYMAPELDKLNLNFIAYYL